MKRGILAITTLLSFSAVSATFPVYFLGGQSNMEGYGKSKDLEPLHSKMMMPAAEKACGRRCSQVRAPDLNPMAG